MIRVIAGSAKGRRLNGPPPASRRTGAPARHVADKRRKPAPADTRTRTEIHAETRPTSDMIRGVIFDMLDAMGASYDRVLDLYAGTGALGIEALSRGEGEADFVERDPGAVAVIEANLRICGFEERGRVHRLTTQSTPNRLATADLAPYTLILADPPYYDDGAPEAVRAVAETALVGPETVLVWEHHRRLEPPESLGPLALYRTRRHGDSVVSVYGEAAPTGEDEEVEDTQ